MKIDFEKEFNNINVEKVMDIIEEYLPLLYGQDTNLDITKELDKLYFKIEQINNREIIDLFDRYNDLSYIQYSHQIWLAYYIGFKRGFIKGKS